jgi:hypothetical protein
VKLSELFEAIERFFLDLIGTIIPGIVLVLGCLVVLDRPLTLGSVSLFPLTDTFNWVFLVVVGYITGHAVISIGFSVLLPTVEFTARILRKNRLTSWLVPGVIKPYGELMDGIAKGVAFQAMVKQAKKTYSWLESDLNSAKNVRSWRNVALTISQENSHIVYRFMFISLLNLGMATVLIFLTILWLFISVLNNLAIVSRGVPIDFWIVGILLLSSIPFLERRYQFYRRAMEVPFSMAVVKLQQAATESVSKEFPHRMKVFCSSVEKHDNLPKVYLAGGFHSGWQDSVIAVVPSFAYFDPRFHELKDENQYVLWDLEAIRRSDWVFAYLEATNPAGYALALEIGFAKALGKPVVLVDEKSSSDEQTKRYLAMVRASADVVFESLEEGIAFIRKFEKLC